MSNNKVKEEVENYKRNEDISNLVAENILEICEIADSLGLSLLNIIIRYDGSGVLFLHTGHDYLNIYVFNNSSFEIIYGKLIVRECDFIYLGKFENNEDIKRKLENMFRDSMISIDEKWPPNSDDLVLVKERINDKRMTFSARTGRKAREFIELYIEKGKIPNIRYWTFLKDKR